MVAFIDAHRDAYGVEPICTQLPIAPSTYYVSEAQKVLVDTQWCQKRVPCSAIDLVKFEAGGWQFGPLNYGGVYINVYQVDDISVADKVIARFREKKKSMPGVPVHVGIYASKHNEPKKKITAEAKIE